MSEQKLDKYVPQDMKSTADVRYAVRYMMEKWDNQTERGQYRKLGVNAKELRKKFPKLRKVYGAPSINANEDLNALIEDYNKIEEWHVNTKQKLQKLQLIQKIEEIQENLLLDCVDGGYYNNELEKIKEALEGFLDSLK